MPLRSPRDGDDTSPEYRFFTLEEASRTLPLVRRIVHDIVSAYPAFREKLQEFDALAGDAEVEATRERLQALREGIDRDAETINRYIAELHQIGCIFKGFEEGLVDFYSTIDGKPVFLCWKYDEPEISFWHEIEAGLAGRQPLAPTA